MARRMFSDEIVGTDSFLSMPQSTQNLYFRFGMEADDDGFVGNPKTIIRKIGANEDDLNVLIAKKFVIPFVESGILVVKHWRINNQLRKDRYRETKYLKEKSSLLIRENGAYTLTKDERAKHLPNGYFSNDDVDWLPDGCQVVVAGKVSIGKVREGKESIEENFEEEKEEVSSSKKEKVSIPLPEWIDAVAWGEWLQHRKERKLASYKPLGLKKLFTKLEKDFNKDTQRLKDAIDFSIAKNYMGIFEENKNSYNKNKPAGNVINTNSQKIIDAIKNKK